MVFDVNFPFSAVLFKTKSSVCRSTESFFHLVFKLNRVVMHLCRWHENQTICESKEKSQENFCFDEFLFIFQQNSLIDLPNNILIVRVVVTNIDNEIDFGTNCLLFLFLLLCIKRKIGQ